jgi:CxxC motif-containing protein (DUF1111 family)
MMESISDRFSRTPSARGALVPAVGVVTALLVAGCGPSADGGDEMPLAGGATSVNDRTSHAFQFPAPNLTAEEQEEHLAADAVFGASFVAAPAEINPGLGPYYNNASCGGCHILNGRGLPSVGHDAQGSQLLVRVSTADGVPGVPGGPGAVPGMGTQIGDHAVYGYQPEATVALAWLDVTGTYADGTPYTLRRPQLTINTAEGPLGDDVMISPRLPPPVFGLGLLEAIRAEDIEALADPDDRDGDGISGHPNYVYDAETGTSIGRFGHKAGNPTLRQQAAGAFADDMGVSNPIFQDADGSMDIDEEILSLAAYYTQTLAVPNRVDYDDPQVMRGEVLFGEARCAGCHVETFTTGPHEIPALSSQTIHPYTDLLLHDMGADLADDRPDFQASGTEWRTPPLWGIGLTETVLGSGAFLHDGRARTLEEAILWHGGEADASRERFRTMSQEDREALIAFLRSL